MPKQQKHKFQIGDYWLDQRAGSPMWYRCWYDKHHTTATSKRRGHRKRASLGTTDFYQAQLALAQWVIENNKPDKQEPGEVLLEQILLDYWQEHGQHLASAEVTRYALKHWSTHYGSQYLSAITPQSQRAMLGYLIGEQKLSPGYAKRVIGVGKAAINHAYKHGRVMSVPHIELPGVPDPSHRQLKPAEVRALFENVGSAHGLMYLLLAFTTLARETSILELSWYQVDLPNRLLRLNPPERVQTKKRRPVVPIPKVLLPFVSHRREGRIVNYHGQPVKSVKKMLAETGKRAGIGPIGSRVPRHTMATMLRREGVPAWEVQGLLGHKMPTTSETYAAYTPDYLSTASQAIDNYMSEHVGLVLEQRAKELKLA